jgi:tRNA 5-methylaminomethyl-2-thiouridine biosynthesis bifunctional protein
MSAQQAIVVGAGLAGAAAARALADKGWHILVLESGTEVCSGGSAVPVGVMSCHVSIDDNPLSQLTREGLLWTRRFAQSHLEEGVDWLGNGVLERRLTPEGQPKKAWLKPLDDSIWHEHVSLATTEQLAQAGLAQDDTQSLWQHQGAWIKPHALVKALLKHDAISIETRTEVESMQRNAATGEWTLRIKNHIAIPNMGSSHTYSTETASHVVLALGAHTPDFLNQVLYVDHMGLHPIAGQVSWGLMPEAGDKKLPDFAVNGHGSFVNHVPTSEGPAWFTGATFERNAMSTVVSAQGHAENQKRLTELLPLAAEQLRDAWNNEERLKGWTGVRCASVNRMPKAGALDEAQFPGVHLLTAMGSRGLTLSLLCAEVLACQMDGRPAPVSDKLVQAMRCLKIDLSAD